MIDYSILPAWFTVLTLFVVGAILGSFAGAQVWRLRARQLSDDSGRLDELRAKRKSGRSSAEEAEFQFLQEISSSSAKREQRLLAPLLKQSAKTDRSRCLSCHHQLAWYDLLPVLSWLSTGGKCRYCGAKIGRFEMVIELALGMFFTLSYVLWPFAFDSWLLVAAFVVWLAASVPLAMLFSYDAKWYLLPDAPMAAFRVLAVVYAGLILTVTGLTIGNILSLIGAVAAIGGLYWVLHAVSRGAWVGYGDVRLGVGLGLLLVQWPLAVVAVVLANAVGTLLVLPALLTGRLDRQSHIPFGPLLIVGTVLANWWGQGMIDWYMALL